MTDLNEQQVIDAVSTTIFAVLQTVAPPLLLGLAVGLAVAIFQAVTSIQEQTLAFIPKIVAVFLSLVVFGPFILDTLIGLFRELVTNIPHILAAP